ncbi:pectinesterase family protein [Pelagicoccus enzymogenes]|nr:pectinesterase family protein [Pelagicoccus enzymogenes]
MGLLSLTLSAFISGQTVRNHLVVARDGAGDFASVQEAIDASPSNSESRFVIFIKPGTYKEKIRVPAEKSMLKLVGESYETVILTYDDHAKITSDYASTRIYADDFYAENITFQNTIDSRSGGSQAAALRVDGDRAIFYRCRMTGFQDTYYLGGNRRSYNKDCIIEGTTDFIYGDGISLFEDCTINLRKDSHITAHSQRLVDGKPVNEFGYVFKNCRIQLYLGETVSKASLGRPWREGARVVYLNCYIPEQIRPEGWSVWNQNSNHETTYFAEYRNTGPGSNPSDRLPWTHQLSETEAAAYTIENIFRADTTSAVALEGDWIPLIERTPPIPSAHQAK